VDENCSESGIFREGCCVKWEDCFYQFPELKLSINSAYSFYTAYPTLKQDYIFALAFLFFLLAGFLAATFLVLRLATLRFLAGDFFAFAADFFLRGITLSPYLTWLH
jgi:hypothetical protein